MFAGVNVMNGTSMPKKYDCRSCGEEYPQGVKCDRCPPVEGVQEFYEKLYDRIRLDDFTRLTKITALEFALSLAEAYADFRATQERERADAAERERDDEREAIERSATILLPLVDTKDGTLVSLAENAAKEIESLRTELREAAKSIHINYCDDLVADGMPWEVPAEPEPQYFETFSEALKFRDELAERELREAKKLAEDRAKSYQAMSASEFELRRELREMREALERVKAIIPRWEEYYTAFTSPHYVVSGPPDAMQGLRQCINELSEALLSRKGEGS